MEDDQIFIDKLVKKSIKNYKVKPSASWNEMEMYMKDKGVVSKTITKHVNINNIRTDIAIISGILVITAGVIFFRSETEKQSNPKEIIENISDTTSNPSSSILKIDEVKSGQDTLSEKNTEMPDLNENKTVKIKIEVPVHKNVIIKKQIIIKDTLN